MGMFDSVIYKCECGEFIEWQSKEGKCSLAQYFLTAIPIAIAKDINNTSETCTKCGKTYCIYITNNTETVPMNIREI